ncbi:MAG: class I SAM-dependent methyltransferase [Candidatus Paceibacterota bacterium]
MSKPLQEKLRVARYIDPAATNILDVGCADGTVTLALATLFPEKQFLGIDLDEEFVAIATDRAKQQKLTNVRFERTYLRELLSHTERYDSVLFVSVLHEFFTYGEGISSVLKAMADAEEILRPGGDIVIRDMILLSYTKQTDYLIPEMRTKIASQSDIEARARDFETHFGPIKTIYAMNHFLLKYMYAENWDRECVEHYVPVTFEQYENIFSLLGMEMVLRDSYLLPFLREKWLSDFSFTEDELAPLASTGFLVARKHT